MKKILALLTTIALAASMVACSSAPASSTAPEATATPAPTEKPEVNVEPEEIYDAVMDAVFGDEADEIKNYLPDIDPEAFAQMTGMDLDLAESFKAVMPMMSQGDVNVCFIFKAVEGKAGDIESALNEYKANDIKAKDPSQGGMSYPGDLEKANATKIVTVGNYVAYFSFDDKMSEFEGDAQTTHLEEINDKAIEAMNTILG